MARLVKRDKKQDEVGVNDTVIEVAVSERNLLALLAKLYTKGSRQYLISSYVEMDGESTQNVSLVIKAEKDDDHYDDARRGIYQGRGGPVHADSEDFITKLQEFLKDNEHDLV